MSYMPNSKNLLICHSEDEDALWLFYTLKEKGHNLDLVNADSIPSALKWKYFLNTMDCEWELWLSGKEKIHSSEINCVINRMRHANPYHWQKSSPDEYHYVAGEMHALYLSWLHSISQQAFMLNPPGGNTLSGNFFIRSYWLALASKAGLMVKAYSVSSKPENSLSHSGRLDLERSFLLINEDVIGAEGLPANTLSSCRSLVKLSGNPLLEITLIKDHQKWIFEKADPFPAFKKYSNKIVDTIEFKKHFS
jgi:hypothetical protein